MPMERLVTISGRVGTGLPDDRQIQPGTYKAEFPPGGTGNRGIPQPPAESNRFGGNGRAADAQIKDGNQHIIQEDVVMPPSTESARPNRALAGCDHEDLKYHGKDGKGQKDLGDDRIVPA